MPGLIKAGSRQALVNEQKKAKMQLTMAAVVVVVVKKKRESLVGC